MPTRNVNLTQEQDAFIDEVVRRGQYQNASEAVRDALRGWQQRLEEDGLKLERLRAEIRIADDQIARGAFSDVDADELEGWMDRLVVRSEA